MDRIRIELADTCNFNEASLDAFDRFQEVCRVYRNCGGKLISAQTYFTEDWSPERKREKASEILSGEYDTYCAFEGDRVVGEMMLVKELDHGRLIVDSLHVSREHRRCGIGRMLLNTAVAEAEQRGARALYFSACSAVETVRFYTAMGFSVSEAPIPEYAADEPCDIQMERPLFAGPDAQYKLEREQL